MWERLGSTAPSALATARLQAHWASQLVAAAGTTLLEPQPDFSHTSLAWDADARRMAGARLPDGRRAALRLDDLSLHYGADSLALDGQTVAEGLEWISIRAGQPLARPQHDLPDHPVATGGTFSAADGDALGELAEWFAATHAWISTFIRGRGDASPIRLWPHHFDLATLLTVREAVGESEARTIGVGLSPGDGSYDHPYVYVTPWPYPSATPTTALPARGQWHSEGWMGAVLRGADLLENGALDSSVAEFMAAAVAAWTDLLGPG